VHGTIDARAHFSPAIATKRATFWSSDLPVKLSGVTPNLACLLHSPRLESPKIFLDEICQLPAVQTAGMQNAAVCMALDAPLLASWSVR
jgi:hypothetical protein